MAIGLLKYHGRNESKEDLGEAIHILRDLVDSVPSGGVELPTISFNLSNGLNVKYEYPGEMRLLEESIEYARRLADVALKRYKRQPGDWTLLPEN